MQPKAIVLYFMLLCLLQPAKAYGDFWGGDIPLLTQIVANTLQQLVKLSQMVGKSQETLDLIRDLNRGIQEAMDIIRTRNSGLSPGILSDLQNVQEILSAVESLYGRIPKTQTAKLQAATDTSVAESIHLHNEVFRYADQVDPEAERLKDYARNVSPLGAQKLTAQGMGVLIHVMNQILRTNAAILKLQSQQLAMQNRSEKLSAEQFKYQYEEISSSLKSLKPNYRLSVPRH